VVSPIILAPVNVADTSLFPACLEAFVDLADIIGLDTRDTTVTLDAGFDSHANEDRITFHSMVSCIRPNMRREKREDVINERLDAFDEKTYKTRFPVERTFAWEDSYRKLAQRYEILEETHLGFKYLAFSMMNLKEYL
jgi:transposase